MTVPAAYILRSYGGGAEPAQLTTTIGASDTSFGISATTGWTEADGSPLGTVGPFTVIIDRFSDTVEKITCSAINLTTGIVTVDTTGGSGRGADGTTPQGHSPGSVGGVQTCMTSVEAAEFNKLVNLILGGSPSTGQILTWASGVPAWGATGSLTGNPAGTMAATAQTIVPSGTGSTTQITSLAAIAGGLKGGVTVASNGLTVPVTGLYTISFVIKWQAAGGGVTIGSTDFQSIVSRNGTQIISASVPGLAGSNPSPGNTVVYPLTAGDVLTLYGYQDSTVNEASAYTGQITPGLATWVSVALASE